VNEAEKLVLFAGEHFWTRWAGIGVETNRERMYPFRLCSAT